MRMRQQTGEVVWTKKYGRYLLENKTNINGKRKKKLGRHQGSRRVIIDRSRKKGARGTSIKERTGRHGPPRGRPEFLYWSARHEGRKGPRTACGTSRDSGLGTLRAEGRKKTRSQTLLASQTRGSGKMISDSGFQPPRNGAFKRGLGKFPSQPLSQHILVDVLTQRAPTFVASGAGDPVRV